MDDSRPLNLFSITVELQRVTILTACRVCLGSSVAILITRFGVERISVRAPPPRAQVLDWFVGPGAAGPDPSEPAASVEAADSPTARRMPVCRIKNKFAFRKDELVGGYLARPSRRIPHPSHPFLKRPARPSSPSPISLHAS